MYSHRFYRVMCIPEYMVFPTAVAGTISNFDDCCSASGTNRFLFRTRFFVFTESKVTMAESRTFFRSS